MRIGIIVAGLLCTCPLAEAQSVLRGIEDETMGMIKPSQNPAPPKKIVPGLSAKVVAKPAKPVAPPVVPAPAPTRFKPILQAIYGSERKYTAVMQFGEAVVTLHDTGWSGYGYTLVAISSKGVALRPACAPRDCREQIEEFALYSTQ